MNLLGTFQPRLPIIGCNPFCYYIMVLKWHCNRHDREFKKKMHKFHTLQCKNNKLLLSNHHLLLRNIYTLCGSSSSVCDGEHCVLKIHKLLLLLFVLVFKLYPSCSHPLEKIFIGLANLIVF